MVAPSIGRARGGLDRVVANARVVVCLGPGGVGKTSTAAAIALWGAREGRRSLVLTIDPAKRLANALGLPDIGHVERQVSYDALRAVGLPEPRGRMTAMMLDIKSAWDEVVSQHHPDPQRRQRLMDNRLYVALSTALAGSQEYMAMEKLYSLSTREEDRLDLLVLDTPPAEHVMDFLEAPSRILDALDNEATRWLVEPFQTPGRVSKKIFDAGSSFFIRTISRFTGTELLRDLAELLTGFQGMFEGFRARADAVRSLLGSADTTFLIVGTPRSAALEAVRRFHARLVERGALVGGAVLNRSEVDPLRGAPLLDAGRLRTLVVEAGGTVSLADRMAKAVADSSRAFRREESAARALSSELDGVVVRVPELTHDIHDLVGLDELASHLFPGRWSA